MPIHFIHCFSSIAISYIPCIVAHFDTPKLERAFLSVRTAQRVFELVLGRITHLLDVPNQVLPVGIIFGALVSILPVHQLKSWRDFKFKIF